MYFRPLILLCLAVAPAVAQLTMDQRAADFRSLADLYARRYSPIQWKQQAFHYDLLQLKPWLDRLPTVKNDLDFYDLMVEYVSKLQDAHDQYSLPSDFEAQLGFTTDIYDGKVLIDSVDRTLLAADMFPFTVGDELVSVDGVSAQDLVQRFSKYVSGGNPRTVQRLAAGLIAGRFQSAYPYAAQIGETATVVVHRQSDAVETYAVPWRKSGTPITVLGASPGPVAPVRTAPIRIPPRRRLQALLQPRAASVPRYQQWIDQLHNYKLPGRINVLGFDELHPVFDLPDNFAVRLGSGRYDLLYSGTYTAPDGTKIGFLRIPDFIYVPTTDLTRELSYFQTAVDVLVLDVMRNPGGDVCEAENVLSHMIDSKFYGAVAEMRVDWTDIVSVNSALADAQHSGADADTIAYLQLYQSEFQKAFMENKGVTAPVPLCGSTVMRDPARSPFTKPVLLLADEMSASSADMFAAMAQDNQRARLFGYRTMGAGGSPEEDYTGVYTEGWTMVTRSLAVRANPVVTGDYPTTVYVENVGVRPDTVADYMTADNLRNHGKAFVDAFTGAAAKLAKQGQ